MRRKVWPLVLLCFLSAEVCFAKKEHHSRKEKKGDGPEIIHESKGKSIVTVKKDSRDNRGDSHIIVTPSVGAMVFPVPKLTLGIEAGLFLFQQNVLLVDYFHSSGSEYYSSLTAKTEANCISARLKRYFGNSINMEAGVTIKSIAVIIEDSRIDDDSETTETYSSTTTINQSIITMGPQLTFGNQWQFPHFTLGGNWVEIFVPVSVSAQTANEESLTNKQKARAYTYGTKRAGDIEFSVRGFIGASF